MKIVVIGGTGLIGKQLVARLAARGHEALAASPNTGVNTLTGEGLAEALEGAQVVVDVANSPSFEDHAVMDFFATSGRNLLAAEAVAGVRHHVALSVVGTDRLQGSGYFRAKLAQETLVKAAGIPYTLVRATQFMEFLGAIAQSGSNGSTVRLSPAMNQPIAASDVASAMADAALGAPVNGTIEIAGPGRVPLSALVARYLVAISDPRTVVADADAPYFGLRLDDGSPDAWRGSSPGQGQLRRLARGAVNVDPGYRLSEFLVWTRHKTCLGVGCRVDPNRDRLRRYPSAGAAATEGQDCFVAEYPEVPALTKRQAQLTASDVRRLAPNCFDGRNSALSFAA